MQHAVVRGVRGELIACRSRLALNASRAAFSSGRPQKAISTLKMPSMSPTMEQGGITSWKVKEGEKYAAGDVLLSIETDKAEIDVEAQDDGIMGKILYSDGTSAVKVGEPIALLAEEGDDISNLEVPKEASKREASASKPAADPSKPEAPKTSAKAPAKEAPTKAEPKASSSHAHAHSTELPSVQRLLATYSLKASDVTGTGYRGKLTKGDVLAAAKQIKSAAGSYTTERAASIAQTPKFATDFKGKGTSTKPAQKVEIEDVGEYRRMFLQGLGLLEQRQRAAGTSARDVLGGLTKQKPFSDADYDAILQQYLPPRSALAGLQAATATQPAKALTPQAGKKPTRSIVLPASDPYSEVFA